MNHRSTAYVAAAGVILADQATKVWAAAALTDRDFTIVPGILDLSLTRNTGAAFSTFTSDGPILGLIGAAIAVFIAVLAGRTEHRHDALALGLVLGGAVGNLIDRIVRGTGFLDGAVVDWIDLSFWPTFNAADSGISIGVVLLLIAGFRHDG